VEAVPTALGIAAGARGDPVVAILAAANVGDDADTVAAIAGAVCGAGSGPEALPEGWIGQRLAARLRTLAARLVRVRGR
jgi:ADP-ribosylglycohydrolase